MSLLKLDNFADALLNKYETTTLNEDLTDCGFMSNFNEDFFTEEKVAEVKSLNESFNGSINECSVFSLDDKEELTETVARSPRYELEDLGNLIEDAKAALEDKDMENMYLFGHTIYDFIEENKNELNEVVIDELGNLQDELEAEAQKLDESCNKNLKEGFADDLFVKAVDIVVDFIHDNFDSIPDAKELEAQIKENMGEFSGFIGDQAEIVDVAATYYDLPSIVDAALDVVGESLNESVEEPKKVLKLYYNQDDEEDPESIIDMFGELPKTGWYTKDEWNALPSVDSQYGYLEWDDMVAELEAGDESVKDELLQMRPINEQVEMNESLNEDLSDARPNHTTILDMLESGALDYKETAEELLRWMPDDKLADFISLYIDPMFDELEESVEEIKPTHRGRKLHSEE